MKATRLIALVLAVVSLFSVLASCNVSNNGDGGENNATPPTTLGTVQNATLSTYVDSSAFNPSKIAYTAASLKKLDLPVDGEYEIFGELFGVKSGNADEDVYTIYNIEKDITFRIDLTDYAGYSWDTMSTMRGERYLLITRILTDEDDETDALWVYNSLGDKIFSVDSYESYSIDNSASTLTVDKNVIYLNHNRVEGNFKIPAYLNSQDCSFGKTYVCVETNGVYIFYTENFQRQSSFTFPALAEKTSFTRIGEKKAFVSYSKKVAPDASNYDYYEDNQKYDLFMGFFDIETGTTTEIQGKSVYPAELMTESTYSYIASYYGYKKDINCLLGYYPILDKAVVENQKYAQMVVVNEDGTFGAELKVFPDQIDVITPIDYTGYFKYRTATGIKVIDFNGTVVLELDTNMDISPFGDKYVVESGNNVIIYDRNFEVVEEFERCSVNIQTNFGLILYNYYESKYVAYEADGDKIEIDQYCACGIYRDSFSIDIHSVNGDTIYDPESDDVQISYITSYSGVVIVKIWGGETEASYYRISN